MNATSTPLPERHARRVDFRGWIILAWVLAWSIAYVHSALGERFPWVRSWLGGWF